jgi:peptidoglycan/LPS O-acetylase OafA/YrhL
MNYGTAILKGSVNFRDFAIRRFSRLYPLHLATLLLVGLLQHLYRSTTGSYWIYDLNDGYHFIQQMLFASNWFRGGGFSYNGPVWSVSVELVAYVAFFFLALSGKLSILWSALVMVAAGLGRIISPDYEALFTCILFFFAGGIAYRLGYLLRHEPQSLPMWVVPVAVFLVTAEILLLVSAPHPLQLIDPDFVLVVLVPGLIFLAGDRIKLPVLFERIVRVLGNMTYSSYLLQFPIQLFVALICAKIGIRIPYASNLLFILFILCTLLLAYLSYQYFERPAQQWIRFFGLKR